MKSNKRQTDSCCINPDWIDPDSLCPFLWDPVKGCDSVTYSNSCTAAAAGVTSWTDASGNLTTKNWNCGNDDCVCLEIYVPVCGSDSITYSNSCFAGCAGVDFTPGCCSTDSTCESDCVCPEIYEPVCGSDSITYSNSCFAGCAGVDSITVGCCSTDSTCESDCVCPEIYEPVCGSDSITYSNSCFAGCAGVDSITVGCCSTDSTCVLPLCTSHSGIEIYESGEWVNPNDPCDLGYCGEDGFFSGVIIDCAQQMGIPCDDGEYVLEDGLCCSTCVKNPCETLNAQSEKISITLNQGWNMIGFACAEDTNAEVAFLAIVDKLIIAKNIAGAAYLPNWGYNGLGNLERGYGYLIKVTEEITNYNVCE